MKVRDQSSSRIARSRRLVTHTLSAEMWTRITQWVPWVCEQLKFSKLAFVGSSEGATTGAESTRPLGHLGRSEGLSGREVLISFLVHTLRYAGIGRGGGPIIRPCDSSV